MIQDDDNLPFENIINNHDEFSTRIIFTNTNGLNVYTDYHSLREVLINSKLHCTSVFLLAETNTYWKNKRNYDNFGRIISQYWKGAAVTTSETNLNRDSIHKPGGTAIIVDNEIRSRKIKSREDSRGLGRWSYLTLYGREDRMVIFMPVYKLCIGPIHPTKKLTASTQ